MIDLYRSGTTAQQVAEKFRRQPEQHQATAGPAQSASSKAAYPLCRACRRRTLRTPGARLLEPPLMTGPTPSGMTG
jgi:hypothetical protein